MDKSNQITQMLEKALSKVKNPAYKIRQAIIKKREEDIKQVKADAGLDKGV